MEDQAKFPDLTDAERKALEELMPDDISEIITSGLKRRHFLKLITFSGTSLLATHFLGIEQLMARTTAGAPLPPPPTAIENGVNVAFKINGSKQNLLVDSRMTLLDALRERLALTGSKKGCDHGQCGACTVLVDGRRVLSCLTLAATCEDKVVTTIEGIADGDTLHPMQAAFIKHDGFQCGYCTPGQICSAVALLSEAKNGEASYVTPTVRQTGKPVKLSDEEIRERMSGNICRCGAYPNIVDAIREVHGDQAVAQVWQFADGTI
jgi:xanthine dehydrogenase YagT iron-sulfur-binding subunit